MRQVSQDVGPKAYWTGEKRVNAGGERGGGSLRRHRTECMGSVMGVYIPAIYCIWHDFDRGFPRPFFLTPCVRPSEHIFPSNSPLTAHE